MSFDVWLIKDRSRIYSLKSPSKIHVSSHVSISQLINSSQVSESFATLLSLIYASRAVAGWGITEGTHNDLREEWSRAPKWADDPKPQQIQWLNHLLNPIKRSSEDLWISLNHLWNPINGDENWPYRWLRLMDALWPVCPLGPCNQQMVYSVKFTLSFGKKKCDFGGPSCPWGEVSSTFLALGRMECHGSDRKWDRG
jgi:hypothetical protein